MIYIVAENRDGVDVKEFKNKDDAETFCSDFLFKHRNYGGAILLAVEGFKLTQKPVEVVRTIELLHPSEANDYFSGKMDA